MKKYIYLLIALLLPLTLQAATHLRLNGVPLVADSVAGKIYASLEPQTADNLQATMQWDGEVQGVQLDGLALTDAAQNFTVEAWPTSAHTLTVATAKETRSWEMVFTTLPLIVIDANQTTLYNYWKQDSDAKHPSHITVIDPRYRTEGQAEFESKVMMRVRGVTSAGYPKKCFAVELVDDNGEERDVRLMGYRNDGDWILDAMYSDYARMRTRINFDLWNACDDLPYDKDNIYQMNGTQGEFVEVFMAGRYNGLYCFTDKIDRKKLNLKKTKEATASSSEKTRGLLWKSKFRCGATTLSKYDTYPTNDTLVWEKYWEQKYPDDRQSQAYFNPIADAIDAVGRNASRADFAANWQKVFYPENIVDYVIFSQAFQWMDNLQKNYYFSVRNITKDDSRLLFTPWDLDATMGRAAGGDDLVDDPKWYAFGEQLGGINYLIWRLTSKKQTPEGFATMLNNRWQYLKQNQLSLTNVRCRMQAYADLFNRSGAWKREKALCDKLRAQGAKKAETPEEEIDFIMAFLEKNYQVFDEELAQLAPDAYTEPSKTLYIIGQDRQADFEGNSGTVPGTIAAEPVDGIESIGYADGKMTVNREEGTTQYSVADIKEVKTKGADNYAVNSFLPEAYKEAFDFDTHYAHPGLTDTTAYVAAPDYTVSRTISIAFDNDVARISGNTEGMTINANGTHITVDSPVAGVHYVLRGQSSDALLTLQGQQAAKITLDGARLTNKYGATVKSESTGAVSLTTGLLTQNVLSGIESAANLTLSGEGELQIVSEADSTALVRVEGDIMLLGGVLNMFASGYDSKGFYAGGNISVAGGNTHIITAGSSEVEDASIDDLGCHALFAKKNVNVSAGKLYIKTVGLNGGAGIATLGNLTVAGGEVLAACFDDPVNAEGSVTVNGGTVFTSSLVDDGFQANAIYLNGGTLHAIGPYPQESAFDTNGKTFALKGGTLIGIGAKSDKPQASKSAQAYVAYNKGEGIGRYVRLADATGAEILSLETPAYSKTTLVLSSPLLQKGVEYTLSTCDEKEGSYREVSKITAE